MQLRRLITAPLAASLLALTVPAGPARAADGNTRAAKPIADDDCTKGNIFQQTLCRAKKSLKKKAPAKPPQKAPVKRGPARPPVNPGKPPAVRVPDRVGRVPSTPAPHTPQPPTKTHPPVSRAPAPDPRRPGGGGGGGGGSRNSKGDCCAMAGLGTGGLIIGGLTGLLAGAATGGLIGFFIPPEPKTDAQRGIDAGVGALIGGGSGAFMGGAIGLGLGLAAGGVVAGGEE